MSNVSNVILRNSRAEQFLCAAKKNFIEKNGYLSETGSKTLICHFSDLHGDWKRFDNILDMINYYKPVFAMHTGDLVCWDSTEETDVFFEKIKNVDTPIYNCIGNHETYFGEGGMNNDCLHNRYIKPLNNIHTTGKGYYYTDFTEQNIRLIVLNNYDNDNETDRLARAKYEILQVQCDWLIDVLLDCVEKGIGVIIAAHDGDERVVPGSNSAGFCQKIEPEPWGPSEKHDCHIVADIIDAFKHGKKLERRYKWISSGNEVNINCKFDKESEFICYMNGHRHADFVGYLSSYSDQLSFGITCSGCFPEGYHNIGDEVSNLPRIPGTVSEDAVNFYVLDRENKTVSIIRMGASVNNLFEEHIAAKFKY